MGLLRWIASGSILRVITALIVLAMTLVQYPALVRLDDWAYSRLSQMLLPIEVDQVAVIAIDEASLQSIGGPWPWPRTYMAEGIKALQNHDVRVIGLIPSLPAPEWNPGLTGLRSLQQEIPNKKSFSAIRSSLARMEVAVDGDLHLKNAIKAAGSVIFPLLPTGEWTEQPKRVVDSAVDWQLPERIWQVELASLHNPFDHSGPAPLKGILSNFKPLSAAASAHGFMSVDTDLVSPHFLLISPRIKDYYFPSLALQLVKQYLGGKSSIKITENRIQLGDHDWRTGDSFSIMVRARRMSSVPVFSYKNLVTGQIDSTHLQGKVVLIGLTTDADRSLLTYKSAAVVAALLSDTLHYRPHWAFLPELALLIFFSIFTVLIVPRLNPWPGFILLLFFTACWVGTVAGLLIVQGIWLQLVPVLVLILSSSLVLMLQRAVKSGEPGYEDLKLLGLSLQGQGMLDMAFDKFMQCPVHDPSVREILYNLGLDFERKRMFNKAVAVYQHLLKGGKFKDAKKKVVELQDTEGTVVLGASGGGKNAGLGLSKGRTAPTLGRYEIIRELGQGAMGTVYLGRDPKINREVAIKTLNIRDIEPQQVEEVKIRFYREAEAAGGLNHPNIVTIYDAGEEHDLAFMAMEYISGQTLAPFCVKNKLLALDEVLRIAAEIADALAYAHDNHVIHRDIKPANIMLLDGGKIKVTDFGIARVMSTSHTQTGTILGTPSYMSPEQVAGKKVDGRSDLFSLGVVCYELLTGVKPFTGDNIGALMYSISQADYVPLSEKAKRLPRCVHDIVDKLLAKGVTKRFKSAKDVAQALRACSSRRRKS